MIVEVKLIGEQTEKTYWFNCASDAYTELQLKEDTLYGYYPVANEKYVLVDTVNGFKIGRLVTVSFKDRSPDGTTPKKSVVTFVDANDLDRFYRRKEINVKKAELQTQLNNIFCTLARKDCGVDFDTKIKALCVVAADCDNQKLKDKIAAADGLFCLIDDLENET